jgi:hypothetical protein
MTGRVVRRLVFAAFFAYLVLLMLTRPWRFNWGATDEEMRRPLPGDDIGPPVRFVTTRAVTVRASASGVWPWLAQIGWGRGGFYSYNRLENLFGGDLHNADRIHPEWQDVKVGDEVWMAPPGRYGNVARLEVLEVLPGRAIVLGRPGKPGTWAFVVEPLGRHTSRLIVRSRNADWAPYVYAVFGLAHLIMERGMLLGIKARAERAHAARLGGDEPGGTLLDKALPVYEFRGRESIRVNASPEQTYRAFEELTVAEATPTLVRALISLRYLPGRLAGRGRSGEVANGAQPFREAMLSDSNVIFAEEPGREVVVGTVGKFHDLLDQQPVPVRNAEEFARFDDPAYQKLAMGWRVSGDADGCELVMEHRTHALSPGSRRKFALYWWLMIKAGSAVLARMLLRAVERRAEQPEPASTAEAP